MTVAQKTRADCDHDQEHDCDKLLAAAHSAFHTELQGLINRLPIDGTDRVLDVPCGDGFYAALFAERLEHGGEVVAVDIDRRALAWVRRRARRLWYGANITEARADVRAMPFDDETFDFAWCAQSLITLTRRHASPLSPRTIDALREIHRVLRSGGSLGLLEHDEMHQVLLPWPGDLELAIQRARRRGFARLYGIPEQMDIGRWLGLLLAKSGFEPLQRITVSADRLGLPDDRQREFLEAYLRELRKLVGHDLEPHELQEFDRLADPDSPESFFQDPYFEMTWLEIVCLGRKT